jgi:cytosine/adenosine deaminase-related metal-dependent hydrolase
VVYQVFPFQAQIESTLAIRQQLDQQQIRAYVIHVAEGSPTSASGHREFAMLRAQGLLRKGVVIVHGVAIHPEDLDEMARAGVGLVWSPRSNLELYGNTARVAAAKASGVKIAIAPDWAPTGSDGTLAELRFANLWNISQPKPVFTDAELVRMATTNAAELAGISELTGSLKPGLAADIVVVRQQGADGYHTLTHSTASDVLLTMVGGTPLYGDPTLMKQLNAAKPEQVEVCGVKKHVSLADSLHPEENWLQTTTELHKVLAASGRRLAGLSECEE